jgi:sigma-B regulation protein RsbU (phosphoserine phosphatase)
MMKFRDKAAHLLPSLAQQLETVLGTLTPTQRRLLLLSQGKGFTVSEIQSAAPAFGLPEMPPEQGYHLLSGLLELVQRYQQELESAARVQQKLLPEQPPELAGVEIAVRYLPMMGVSGDYYDFLPLGGVTGATPIVQVGLALGDVCGKGMPAALLMASVRAALRAQVQAIPHPQLSSLSVRELLAYLNKVVHRDAPRGQFVTLTYGFLDSISHTFTYSSAGHPPVLHYQATTGQVRELSVGGGVLGVWERMEYPTETVSLGKGDALVLYTDGIIEASDASEEMFGIERLHEVVATHGGESPEALVEAILTAASQFAHKDWEDDVTVMVVKRSEK